MRDGIADLIVQTYTKDDLQQDIAAETNRTIFVTETSVTRREWAAATGGGYNPSIALRTARVNYGGESEVQYEGVRYAIYRTYEDGDMIELYLERKTGVQNGTVNQT